MIILFVITVLLATIILWKNAGNLPLKWLSAAFYAVGFSALGYYLDLQLADAPDRLINTMNFLADAALVYTFGMFGIAYSNLFDGKSRRWIHIALLLLIVVVWLLTPLGPPRHSNYEGLQGLPVVIFICLTLVAGILAMTAAYKKERNPYKKIERFITNLLVVPIMLWACLSYPAYMVGIDLWQYSHIAAIVLMFLFVYMGIRKGALGVKIKVEQLKTDASMQVLQGGASLINHTVKNELGKVDLLLHQLKYTLTQNPGTDPLQKAVVGEYAELASDSVQHILSIMNKISGKIRIFDLSLQEVNLAIIVDNCLTMLEKIETRVRIERHIEPVSEVYCDPAHIKEVIINLLGNAVEAMDHQGHLTIRLSETPYDVILQIQDSGKGIPKESISAIFEPFYSTKQNDQHYGLGLFYCKNIMMKHNGSIRVDSAPGEGSSFYIQLHKPSSSKKVL